MKVSEIVRSMLVADPAVAALVADRVYPDESPDGAALPLIVYAARLGDPADGTMPAWRLALDVHCYAADDDTAGSLATAADVVLAGAAGSVDGTYLRPLALDAWQPGRDADLSEWSRLLSYSGIVLMEV
jgi:hypothetical protein